MAIVTGAILTGGKSSRFGGENKALADLAGKPLIQHVIDRLKPQVSELLFSGNKYALETVKLTRSPIWVSDIVQGQRGPLIGILSCLKYMQASNSEWLLTSGCDTPLLPTNLAKILLNRAKEAGSQLCVPHDGIRLQTANALWHRNLYPILKAAVEDAGIQGVHQFLDTHPHTVANWPKDTNDFINLNTQVDLENAEKLLNTS